MKNKFVIVLVTVIILSGLAIVGYQLYEQRKEEMRMEEEQAGIIESYRRLHYAIGALDFCDSLRWDINTAGALEWGSSYQSLDTLIDRGWQNEHGIYHPIYLVLRMYYHREGTYLSYEKLIDYFSEEFESDGSLRLYHNGNHPEIEAFVIWMRGGIVAGRRDEFEEYERNLGNMYHEYFANHYEEGFRNQIFRNLSTQMFDAIARAEADPDYILDLTSLQEAGY